MKTLPFLAVIGLGWLLARARGALVVLATWFLPAWGTFVFFYAGGYWYGASNRYAVLSAAPVAIAVGIGAAWVFHAARRRPAWLGLAAGLAALSWSRAFAFVPSRGGEAIQVQHETEFASQQARRLPPGSLVVTLTPSLWLIEGCNTAMWHTVAHLAHTNLRELVNQYPGGVYLYYGYWEHQEADWADDTVRTLLAFQAREVARRSTHAMNFALFRLDTPEALERFGGPAPVSPVRRAGELENALSRARPPAP